MKAFLLFVLMAPCFAMAAETAVKSKSGDMVVPTQVSLKFHGDHLKGGSIGPGNMMLEFKILDAGSANELAGFVEIGASTKLATNCEKRVPVVGNLESNGLVRLELSKEASSNACRISIFDFDIKSRTGRYVLNGRPGDVFPPQ